MDIPPTGQLFAFTPSRSGRHDDKTHCSATPKSLLIIAGTPNTPIERYLPPYWSRHIQPEGNAYFVYAEPCKPTVVTECNLYDPRAFQHISFWVKHATKALDGLSITQMTDIEICLELEGEDCFYYVADRNNKTLFWFEQYSSDDLGLELVVSDSHLALALEEQFWRHIEQFPMHFGGLTLQCIDELICVMNHCITDKITSTVSTVLYTEQQCTKLLKVLKLSREYPNSGYQTCAVARIAAQIASQRVLTHYGQENARLSVDQRILQPAQHGGRISTMLGCLSFMESTRVASKLDDLFTDRIVYTEHWQTFLKSQAQSWRDTMFLAFTGVVLNALFGAHLIFGTLGVVSLALFTTSLMVSATLSHRYKSLEDGSCQEIWAHLNSICSPTQGFHVASFILSLPTTLLFWGTLSSILNGGQSLYRQFGYEVAVAAMGLVLLSIVSVLRIAGAPSLFSWHLRTSQAKTDEEMV